MSRNAVPWQSVRSSSLFLAAGLNANVRLCHENSIGLTAYQANRRGLAPSRRAVPRHSASGEVRLADSLTLSLTLRLAAFGTSTLLPWYPGAPLL
jgi:hypothetical protein